MPRRPGLVSEMSVAGISLSLHHALRLSGNHKLLADQVRTYLAPLTSAASGHLQLPVPQGAAALSCERFYIRENLTTMLCWADCVGSSRVNPDPIPTTPGSARWTSPFRGRTIGIALTNVAKYAQASQVTVAVTQTTDPSHLSRSATSTSS